MKARRCFLSKTADLIPPEGHRLDESTVEMLADSIREYGLREPIVVVGRRILHGVHRWAAAKSLGIDLVETVEDEQAVSNEANAGRVIVENLHRRQFSVSELDAMRTELVLLRTAQIAQEMHSVPNSQTREIGKPITNRNPPVKQKTPRGEAIRQVAKETGVSEKAVQNSVYRAEAIATGRVMRALESGRVSTCDEYHNEIKPERIEAWETTRAKMKRLDELCRQLQGECAAITKLGGHWGSVGQRWHEMLHTVAHEARDYSPYAVCPKCGGKGCPTCSSTGFLAEWKVERARYQKLFGDQ